MGEVGLEKIGDLGLCTVESPNNSFSNSSSLLENCFGLGLLLFNTGDLVGEDFDFLNGVVVVDPFVKWDLELLNEELLLLNVFSLISEL